MPRDPRLYMTFPIDMHRHPKVSRLPVGVRWTFFEMNGEARIADNDGVFTEAEAEYLWPKKNLDALVASHPERPLVTRDKGKYTIRDYGEHQQTRAEREQRIAVNRENGKLGGRPPKNPTETDSVTSGNRKVTDSLANVTQPKAESESESELEIPDDVTKDRGSSQVPSNALDGLDPNRVRAAGVKNIAAVRVVLEKTCEQPMSELGALMLVEAVTSKAARSIRNVDAYIATACRNTPAEIQSAYFDLDIGGVP